MPNSQEERAKKILERHTKMKQAKAPWLDKWQLVGEYVMTRKQNFTADHTPGEFLTDNLFDSTAVGANHMMASSFIGQLYPNGGRTFRIEAPASMSSKKRKNDKLKAYFEEMTKRIVRVFDNPKCGFVTCYEEYMTDLGAFGTAGIGAFVDEENEDAPVRFIAVDVKQACVDVGKNNFIDTVYIEKQMSARQMIQEYGDAVSDMVRAAYKDGKLEEKFAVLHAIEPRMDADTLGGYGNKEFPVASIHIEIKTNTILRESGYPEMPIFVSRFWKVAGEKYGRSPAMETMPNIIEANMLRESLILATEKILDPPVEVTDDGTLGGGVIKTGAGDINVRRVSGRAGDVNHNAIKPLFIVGELATAEKRVQVLERIIQADFFIDRLTDLNNDTRMTLGEAQIRNELRGQSLGMVYSRQIAEMLQPLVERVINILFNAGLLGVPPQEALGEEDEFVIPDEIWELIQSGKNAYEVVFVSPAARVMRAEELAGLKQTLQMAVEVSPVAMDVIDNFDLDETARIVTDLTGAPPAMLRTYQKVVEIREARAKAQQRAAAAEERAVQAQAGQALGKGMHEASKAGVPPESFLGLASGQ